MKKNVFFIILLNLLFVCSAIAQRNFSGGLIAGLNFSQIDGDQAGGYSKVGLNGGIRGIIQPDNKNTLSIDLLYSQRGSLMRIGSGAFSDVRLITISYAEIPLMYNMKGWIVDNYYKVGVSAGVSYGRHVGFRSNVPQLSTMEEKIAKNDIALKLGLNYYLNKRWLIQANFTRSLTKIMSSADAAGFGMPGQLNSHHLTIQICYEL